MVWRCLSAEGVRRGIDHSAGAELIGYLGWQHHFGDDWSGGITLRHYDYPGNQHRTRYNYDELALSLAWRERSWLTLVASPDTYSRITSATMAPARRTAIELVGPSTLLAGLAAVAGVGYYDLQRQIGAGYAYWSAGRNHRWRSWAVDLRYVGTDATATHRFEASCRRSVSRV